MSVMRLSTLSALAVGATLSMASTAALAQNRTFSFAYDQPKSSGYGAGAEMFEARGRYRLTSIPARSSAPKHKRCRRCRPATSTS